MGVVNFLLLSCLGVAVTVQAQDCSKPIPGPNMDLKGNDILLQTFPDGTQVSFACSVGYTSAGGSSVITCTAGTWSPVRLICERKNCGSAGEVENGNIDYSGGTEFGDKIVISCNTGYLLVGKREILCGDKGWMDRLPVCEVVTCDPPPQIANGRFSPTSEVYRYGEVVQYSCNAEFTVSGSKSLTCSGDGTFTPAPPSCIKVQCEDIDIQNADWVGGSRPPYGYKATVTFQCKSGYEMKGQGTLTCDINGQWLPGIPQCEMVSCGPPRSVADGTFSPNKPSYNYNEVVEYSCNEGFKLIGSKSTSCLGNGAFQATDTQCTMVTCGPPPSVVDGTFNPKKVSYKYNEAVEYSCNEGFKLFGSKSALCLSNGKFQATDTQCTKIPTTTTTTTTTTTETPTGNGSTVGKWLGIILAVLLVILFGGLIGFCIWKKTKQGSGKDQPDLRLKATKREEEVALA